MGDGALAFGVWSLSILRRRWRFSEEMMIMINTLGMEQWLIVISHRGYIWALGTFHLTRRGWSWCLWDLRIGFENWVIFIVFENLKQAELFRNSSLAIDETHLSLYQISILRSRHHHWDFKSYRQHFHIKLESIVAACLWSGNWSFVAVGMLNFARKILLFCSHWR